MASHRSETSVQSCGISNASATKRIREKYEKETHIWLPSTSMCCVYFHANGKLIAHTCQVTRDTSGSPIDFQWGFRIYPG